MHQVSRQKMAVLTAAGTALSYFSAFWDKNYQQSNAEAGHASPAVMAPFWGPILSVWSSYSRNPDTMTTDKTTTGCVSSRSRRNRVKTHMKMAWTHKRGVVRWLKSHSDSSWSSIQFILSATFSQSHHLLQISTSREDTTEDSQLNQWEESCKSPPPPQPPLPPPPPPAAPLGPRTVARRLCPTAPAGAKGPARMEPIHQPGPQMLTKTVPGG